MFIFCHVELQRNKYVTTFHSIPYDFHYINLNTWFFEVIKKKHQQILEKLFLFRTKGTLRCMGLLKANHTYCVKLLFHEFEHEFKRKKITFQLHQIFIELVKARISIHFSWVHLWNTSQIIHLIILIRFIFSLIQFNHVECTNMCRKNKCETYLNIVQTWQ